LTFGATALFLGALSLLAAYLPARSAARVDPAAALRAE
jgi:ABC-type lipoprotein release transport system permease subunit